MLGNKLRKPTEIIFKKIAKLFLKSNINPNLITLISIITVLLAAYFIINKNYFYALIFIVLTGITDIIDGSFARLTNRVTKFGNYLDAMIDRYVEVIFFIAFAFSGFALESILAMSGSLLLSYAKPRTALVIKIENKDWPSIGDRLDRFLIIILGLLFAVILRNMNIISLMLYFFALITHFGAIQRIFYARKLILKQ
jgi:phosphatidylglycerophosphate synthase